MSKASKVLMIFGGLMLFGLGLTYLGSLADTRTLRDVGVWVKPMKFMAASALFSCTTVWLISIADTSVDKGQAYNWIVALIIVTSIFEVIYITYQGSRGQASHYNDSDMLHITLFGVMAIAAVGLTASQAWLAWGIWKEQSVTGLSVVTLSVVMGLLLTFALSTVSGFLLGGIQPPAGVGLPIVGWHMYRDIRPSHFLGVHAQQFIPLLGLLAARFGGAYETLGLITGTAVYVIAWMFLTWAALST
ncbi:MAG: hypothetical protein LW714_06805 [Oxalobacteraceae bacterium]|nr:hypothetical protein [Oxalobacteraceae bacterium]